MHLKSTLTLRHTFIRKKTHTLITQKNNKNVELFMTNQLLVSPQSSSHSRKNIMEKEHNFEPRQGDLCSIS